MLRLVFAVLAITQASPAPAGADIVFEQVRPRQVVVAGNGAAPTVLARDGIGPSPSADGSVIAYQRLDDTIGVLRSGQPPATVTVRRGGARRPLLDALDIVLSPDGARLAYSVPLGGWNVLDMATGLARPVTTEPTFSPRFSADGRSLAWSDDSLNAYVRPTDRNGRARRVFARTATDVHWVGNRVAVLHGDFRRQRLTLVDPATSARTRPVPAAEAIDIAAVHGDRLLALVEIGEDRSPKRILVVDLQGKVIRTIRTGRRFLGDEAAFSSDGARLFVVDGTRLVAVDLASGVRQIVARDVGSTLASFTPPAPPR